jgi:putative NADH-flavin reductase
VKAILFGATGMVGQGVLRECLLDPRVQSVLAIGRSASETQNPKCSEIVQPDLLDYSGIAARLSGFDACFFVWGFLRRE